MGRGAPARRGSTSAEFVCRCSKIRKIIYYVTKNHAISPNRKCRQCSGLNVATIVAALPTAHCARMRGERAIRRRGGRSFELCLERRRSDRAPPQVLDCRSHRQTFGPQSCLQNHVGGLQKQLGVEQATWHCRPGGQPTSTQSSGPVPHPGAPQTFPRQQLVSEQSGSQDCPA